MAHSLCAEISQIELSQKTKSWLYVKDNKSIGDNAQQQWTSYAFQELLSHATSNVICNVIMGHRFEYHDKDFKQAVYLTNKL